MTFEINLNILRMMSAPSVKLDYASVFLRSATEIFESELSVTLKKRSVTIKHSSKPSFPVIIIIGFIGDNIKGQVIYSMSTEVGEGFARAMLPNMLPVEQRKMVKDILGEVANMISGKASIKLAGNLSTINITPPIVLSGDSTAIDFLKVPTIVVVLDSTLGAVEINIAFQES